MDDTVYDGTSLPPSGEKAAPAPVTVPAGSLAERVEWVAAGETTEERHTRADEVYAHEQAAGDTDLGELGRVLTGVVYQTPQETPAAPALEEDSGAGGGTPLSDGDGPAYEAVAGEPVPGSVTDGPETVAVSTPVEGELVESDVAGAGEAVNAETGEVTAPGQPLPTIEQEDGEPLLPQNDGEDTPPGEQQQNTD